MKVLLFALLLVFVHNIVGNVISTAATQGIFSKGGDKLTAYDANDGRLFATLSAAAYCAEYRSPAFLNWSCTNCKNTGVSMSNLEIINVASTNTWGYVGLATVGSVQRIIVSFAGTKFTSITNWVTNLSFAKTAYSGCAGCEVHTGFLNAYKGARSQVLAAIKKIQTGAHASVPIVIIGHSLGGALANLAVLDLRSTASIKEVTVAGATHYLTGNPDFDSFSLSDNTVRLLGGHVSSVGLSFSSSNYNYGQPRVGNAAYSAYYRQKLGAFGMYRVVHNRDLVPHVPTMGMGFQHATTEIFYNDAKPSFTVCSSTEGEDKNCSIGLLITVSVSDHLNYVGYPFKSSKEAC